MFITPIAFPASSVPEQYKLLFFLNPMAGIVEGIRWSILGGTAMPSYLWVSLLITLLLFVTGVFYFLKVERIMADII